MEKPPRSGTPKKGFLLELTGFTKPSILVLWFLTAGIFAIFCAVHLVVLQPNGTWDTPLTAGERFWVLKESLWYWLNQIHLWSVIPAGIFLPLQFFPAMRRRYMAIHRVSGYVLFTLLGIGTMSGWKMSMTAFSGTTHTKLYGTCLALICPYGIYRSVASVRKLQIDEHRIWVLRTWAYAGSIFTLRIFLVSSFAAFAVFSIQSTSSMSCAEISYLCQEAFRHNETQLREQVASMHLRYPDCLNFTIAAAQKIVPVHTRMTIGDTPPEQATVVANVVFGASGIAGLIANILAVEMYLYWTRGETERLKKVSAAKRKAAGLGAALENSGDKSGEVVEKKTPLQGNIRQRKGAPS